MDQGLAPATPLADAGYVDADLLVTRQTQQGIERLGPVRPDVSGQAKADQGFDLAAFVVDGESKQVIGPTGQTRVDGTPARDHWGNDPIHVGFHRPTCAVCSSRPLCTRARADPREIMLRPRPLHEALQTVRSQQETEAWRARNGLGSRALCPRRCAPSACADVALSGGPRPNFNMWLLSSL